MTLARTGTTGSAVLLAGIAATATATTYAIQPALPDVAAQLAVPLAVIGLVPTAALIGGATGFALLLPLVDCFAANRLVAAQLSILACSLVLAATAAHVGLLLVAYLLVGAAASVAAQAGSIAGRHAPPQRRSAGVAIVAAGMSAGILLSRVVGGALTGLFGWRRMLLVLAALALLGALAAVLILPRERPRTPRYRSALVALPSLLRQHPPLLRAIALGGLWYFAFNLIWVGLALALASPPYSLGPTDIGRYSLAGLLGFVALPWTGRLADRYPPAAVITTSMVAATVGAALLTPGLGTMPVTVAGLGLFDAGCFAAQAVNYSRVIALDTERSGSLGSAYLVLYFAVGALGTAVAAPLFHALGWPGIALTALVASALAAVLGRPRSGSRPGR